MFTKNITSKFLVVALLAWGISPGFCSFKNRTYQEVLAERFKDCKLKKENLFLTKDLKSKIEKELDFKVSSLMLRYSNSCTKSFAYVDSHIVRTNNETVIIEIENKKIKWLEIASFMEPKEYIPPKQWIELLKEKGQKIDGLTGATLSENAMKKLVQKYIVVDNIINDKI